MDESPPRTGWLGRILGRESPNEFAPLPPGIRVDRDVPYGRRPAQRLDVYRPPAGEGCPVLVLVHGGAWAMGDKAYPGVVANKVAHWVPRGWIVISINYRLLPWGRPLEQAGDVARALAAVQSRIDDWGGDRARIVLLGHSTGAHLGALVLADRALGEPFDLRPLQGAVLLDSAALDVVEVMENAPLPLHQRAFGNDSQYWRQVSPWHRIAAGLPPLLLGCSAQRPESVAQAERFAERAREFGTRAEVLAFALPHQAINRTLGTDGPLTHAVDSFLQSLPRAAPGG